MSMFTKNSFLISVLVALMFISSCATLTDDIQVKTHTDPAINFDIYQTYAWADSAQVVFDPIGQWEQPTLDTDEEVRLAINRELRRHGLNHLENNPDLLVTFAAGIDMTVLELKKDPDSDKKVPVNVPEAALVIALVDADSGYVVWSGYAMGDVQQQQSIDNIRARIDYAVRQIFKSFSK